MKALLLTGESKLELKEIDRPVPERDQVVIKVIRAGICASDLNYVKFGSPKLKLSVILGHEGAGIIDEVGEDVKGLKVGQRVVLMNDFYVCGKCRYCRSGDINMCIKRRSLGSAANGVFAEYVKAPAGIVIPIGNDISMEEGAFLEPLACSVHALTRQVSLKPSEVVLVSGPGAIGAGAALVAKAAGCRVIVAGLDKDKYRLDVLKKAGIEHVVNLSEADLKKYVGCLTDGYGVDVAVEASGSYRSLETCINVTRRKGTIVQMGLLHGEPADLSELVYKEQFLHASYAKIFDDWRIAIQLVEDKEVDVRPLISSVLPLDDYQKAFRLAEEASGFKIMFDLER